MPAALIPQPNNAMGKKSQKTYLLSPKQLPIYRGESNGWGMISGKKGHIWIAIDYRQISKAIQKGRRAVGWRSHGILIKISQIWIVEGQAWMGREGLENQHELGGCVPSGCNLPILCSYHRVFNIRGDVKKKKSVPT